MTAATGPINQGTYSDGPRFFSWPFFPLKGGLVFYAGSMVSKDTSGYLRPTRVSTTDIVVGIMGSTVDTTGAADGAVTTTNANGTGTSVQKSVPRLFNSAVAPLDATSVGLTCYAEDNLTLSATNQGGTLGPAGIFAGFDPTSNQPVLQFA